MVVGRSLLREGHVEVALNPADAEGGETGGNGCVREGPDEVELGVEDVHSRPMEVSGEDESAGRFIFAADFHGAAVDIFDAKFNFVRSFTDATVPAGFAPFGIRRIQGDLYVTFAKQRPPDNHDDESGPGNGFVDVFDTKGNLLRRLASQGTLNSPWGLALAPEGFGKFGGALLVGNFGDGRINAFRLRTGDFLGQLSDSD